MNPEVEKTASLIPEFYFDLIARIIPGVIFYACITYAWQGSFYKPGTLLESLLVLTLCYVLGFITDLIGDLALVRLKRVNPVKLVLNELPKVKHPQSVNLLIKMCAEAVLLRSLLLICFMFFTFSVVINIFKTLPQYSGNLALPTFALSILLFTLFEYFQKRVTERLKIVINTLGTMEISSTEQAVLNTSTQIGELAQESLLLSNNPNAPEQS
jgi:hypothetical protein